MDEESPTTTPLLPHHRTQWWRKIPSNAVSSLRLHKTTVWSELGGSVGDLGTYIPIVLALTLVSKLDLGTTLIFTAIYNIVTGLLFGIPMPVQPMKSIASVAISEAPLLTLSQIAAAGIVVYIWLSIYYHIENVKIQIPIYFDLTDECGTTKR